ncbi:MAG: hypothetical protein M1816_002253 [Peltula sp. TS41687]|nr:MAG: hypothetical protein M1816_002253 [Peltula sp. TS41687]
MSESSSKLSEDSSKTSENSSTTSEDSIRPSGLHHGDFCDTFDSIWNDSSDPRHRQFRDANHPKLWACRCFPPPPLEDPDSDDEGQMTEGRDICPQFAERYEIYAYVGGAAWGRFWAARRSLRNHEGRLEYKHFIIKVVPFVDNGLEVTVPSETVRIDTSEPARRHIRLLRYLKKETIVHNMVGDMDAHIAEIVEVYAHRPHVFIVINLVGLNDTRRMNSCEEVQLHEYPDGHGWSLLQAPVLSLCSGSEIHDHKPDDLLAASKPGFRTLGETVEAQICMVFHGILQALHHLSDRGAYLFDLGQARIHEYESGYHVEPPKRFSLHAHMDRVPPDPEFDNPGLLPESLGWVRTDGRRLDLWCAYVTLHKYH